MIKRNIKLLIFLALILIIILVQYFQKYQSNKLDISVKIDTIDINTIEINNKKNNFKIYKNINNSWTLPDNRNANESFIKLCNKIFSSLEIQSIVPKNKRDSLLKIIKSQGTRITLKNKKSKILLDYFLYPDVKFQKTYLLAKNNIPYIVYLPGYDGNFAGVFFVEKSQWYDPIVLNIKKYRPKVVSVNYPSNQSQSFTIMFFEKQKPIINNAKGENINYSEEALEAYLIFFPTIIATKIIEDSATTYNIKKQTVFANINIEYANDLKENINFYRKPSEQDSSKQDKYECFAIKDNILYLIKYSNIDPILRDCNFFAGK